MKIADVPVHPAYLVFHDAYDKGAMDVYGCSDLAVAEAEAKRRNRHIEDMGMDEAGGWKAYSKLPHVRVYGYRGPMEVKK